MDPAKLHRKIIAEAIENTIGGQDSVTDNIYVAKVKTGHRVYRFSAMGRRPPVYRDKDRGNAIYGRVEYGAIPLPDAQTAAENDMLWHWAIFIHGVDVIQARFQSQINKSLPGAIVSIGGNDAKGSLGSFAVTMPITEKPKLGMAITSLFEALPPTGSIWPLEDRRTWLAAAEAMMAVFYREK